MAKASYYHLLPSNSLVLAESVGVSVPPYLTLRDAAGFRALNDCLLSDFSNHNLYVVYRDAFRELNEEPIQYAKHDLWSLLQTGGLRGRFLVLILPNCPCLRVLVSVFEDKNTENGWNWSFVVDDQRKIPVQNSKMPTSALPPMPGTGGIVLPAIFGLKTPIKSLVDFGLRGCTERPLSFRFEIYAQFHSDAANKASNTFLLPFSTRLPR